MIISKIFQGLGNQFFQYAYGLARAVERGTELKIDVSYYDQYATVTQYGYTYTRDFGLNRFAITAQEASPAEIDAVLHPRGRSLAQKINNRYRLHWGGVHKKFHVREKELHFTPDLLHIPDNTYVEGYFTDERYFKAIRPRLVKEFTLLGEPDTRNADYMEQMRQTESVCISIRRTNFLNNPLHGTCGEEYYYHAMDLAAQSLNSPTFFVFSDDNGWVNAHFRPKYPCVFVQHNYPDFYEDFRLMTHCRHHIIPNSTFPWWAAWLAEHPGKRVWAPVHWLKDTPIDFSGYVPADWVRVNHTPHTLFTGD